MNFLLTLDWELGHLNIFFEEQEGEERIIMIFPMHVFI
jgi:hypothetical protein